MWKSYGFGLSRSLYFKYRSLRLRVMSFPMLTFRLGPYAAGKIIAVSEAMKKKSNLFSILCIRVCVQRTHKGEMFRKSQANYY